MDRIGGRYRIGKQLGRGGMASVFEAHDEAEGRDVALKCMDPKLAGRRTALLLFREEFRRLSQISHPNFPAAYDVGGLDEGTPYFAMELVRGRTVGDLEHVDLDTFYSVLTQLLQALSFLHARGYIHRDIKPTNLILSDEGLLKVMDLGLLTPIGTIGESDVRGTPAYIAPEVVRGEVLREPVDLYAVGMMSYQLLTGSRPFKGTGSDVLVAQLFLEVPPLADARPDLPEPLVRLVHRLLEKEVRDRYHTTAEVARDLSSLAGRQVTVEGTAQKTGYLATSHLVGRKSEWEPLRRALDQLKRGRGSAFFLSAPAGVGKSRLLKEARLEAKLAGYHVVSVAAPEHLGDPLAVMGQLLSVALVGRSDESLAPHAAGLAALSPRMRELAKSAPANQSADQMAEAFTAFVRELATERAVVLAIDDLHWADLRSIDLFNRVIRRLAGAPVLVLGTYRGDEIDPSHPIKHTIDEGLTRRISLEPFSRDQVGELLGAMLPGEGTLAPEFVDGVYRVTTGNAFFIDELLRYLIDEDFLSRKGGKFTVPSSLEEVKVPVGLTSTIERRLSRLSTSGRELVEVGAVLGQNFPLSVWHDVSGLGSDPFIEALHEIEERHFVRRDGDRLSFLHESARRIVLEQISDRRTPELHERSGRVLEHRLAEAREEWLPKVAMCFARGHDKEKGIRYSLEAGEAELRKSAEGEAFIHFKRAASILEALPRTNETSERLLAVYERIAQLSSAVWADAPTCLEWFRRAVEIHRAKGNADKVFGLSLSWAITNTIAGKYAPARAILGELAKGVEPDTVPWAVLFGVGVCLTDWYEGRYMDCFRHAEQSIRIFERTLDESSPNDAYSPYSWALFWRDKARSYLSVPIDMACIDKIREMSENGRSDAVILWHTMTAVGARAGFTGRLDDLLVWKTWAEESSRRLGKIYWFECWVSHSFVYGMLGAFELESLGEHVTRLFSSPDPYQRRLGHLFKGRLALAYGDLEGASDSLVRFLDEEKKDGPDNSYGEGLVYLAICRLGQGDLEAAHALASEGLARSTTEPFACPLAELQFRRVLGDVALARGDRATARAELTRAAALAEEQDNPIQRGFAALDLGRLEWASDERDAARARFDAAKAAFGSIGNQGAIDNVDAVLTRLERPEVIVPKPEDDPRAKPTLVDPTTLACATQLIKRSSVAKKLDAPTVVKTKPEAR
jgi:hypothetical protein